LTGQAREVIRKPLLRELASALLHKMKNLENKVLERKWYIFYFQNYGFDP
jgi:radical SAM superfamily enzyme